MSYTVLAAALATYAVHHTGSLETLCPFIEAECAITALYYPVLIDDARRALATALRTYATRADLGFQGEQLCFIGDDVAEMRRIDAGHTLNAGNGSALAHELHEMAYWGLLPKSYL